MLMLHLRDREFGCEPMCGMGKLIYIIVLTILTVNPVLAQPPLEVPKWLKLAPNMDSTKYMAEPMPEPPSHNYSRQMWEPNWLSESWGRFQYVASYPDSFVLSWTVKHSEPEIGYPYHYGNVPGVNDTLRMRVYFDNRSSADFSLSGEYPETWFYPELYDPFVDVFKSKPSADTSAFSYKFEYWTPMRGHTIIDKPDTVYTSVIHGNKPRFSMIFNLWGIFPGSYRVVLEPTSNLPTGIELMLDNPNNVFHIIKGQHILDTLNAYCKTAVAAQYRREFTLANSYVDSIFILNSNCIPGWALRYHIYAAQNDTSNALDAIDSLLYIIDNNLDSFYPDSTKVTKYNEWWLNDYKTIYTFNRWRMRNPNVSKFVKFF